MVIEGYRYVTIVAERLNLPARTVRHWAATGRIPAIRVGVKLWRVRMADVEALSARRRNRRRREA